MERLTMVAAALVTLPFVGPPATDSTLPSPQIEIGAELDDRATGALAPVADGDGGLPQPAARSLSRTTATYRSVVTVAMPIASNTRMSCSYLDRFGGCGPSSNMPRHLASRYRFIGVTG